MKKNLIFIMADSEAYLRDEVLRITKEWGYTKNNLKYTEEWNAALSRNTISLFGEVSITHLDLSDGNKLKQFVSLISDKKEKENFNSEKWFGQGLIITSTHAKGAKKIENLVEKTGGKVIKKATPTEMKKILLDRVNLSPQNKQFLFDFAGDNYQILVGVVNQIEQLDKDKQFEMTTDNLIVRLPLKPGALPPWEFINPMLEGNSKKAIELYERAVEGSHVLVTLKLAKSKLQLLYRIKVLQGTGIRDSKVQAEILGERNGPNIWIPSKIAQRLDIKTCEYLANLSVKVEADLKGQSRIDPDALFKNFIATVSISIKNNQPFHL